MREIISIQIGQGGIQLGDQIWELFSKEHSIGEDGSIINQQIDDNNLYQKFYQEKGEGKLVSRSVFIDSEPNIIDQIKNSKYKSLYEPEQFINGKENSDGNFAKGYNIIGSNLIDAILDKIRMQVENCEDFEGFVISNSVGGGSGSGIGHLLQQKLLNEYEKKIKVNVPIFPLENFQSSNTEIYNQVFSAHSMLELSDYAFVMDNSSIYNICQQKLEIPNPNFININKIIAQVYSSITSSIRFDGCLNPNLEEIKTNLIPHQRFKLLQTSLSPLYSKQKQIQQESLTEIFLQNFDSSNMMSQCNLNKGKFMKCAIQFRGEIVPKNVGIAYRTLKTNKVFCFVDWQNAGCKVGINYNQPVYFDETDIAPNDKSICMIANTTAIAQFIQKLTDQFQHLFDKRDQVHKYFQQNLDEQYFLEAISDLKQLILEYQEAETAGEEFHFGQQVLQK